MTSRVRWLPPLFAVLTLLARGQEQAGSGRLVLMAFGDVNLGRSVGQELLKGNLDYPFERFKNVLQQADVVFVNLESQLTDQNGETQHPRFNLIFCGPPQGAPSLKGANISVVSTANNHAFDYRLKGLRETIRNLVDNGIAFAGTSSEEVSEFKPAIVERNNIRVGFVAFTQTVNIPGPWKGRIALYDEQQARRAIEGLRGNADFIVASYHAGSEYVDAPDPKTLGQMHALIDAGADLVVGHHPHVPQGIELYRDKLIFYSLGNFVFYQPQLEWTQRSFGVQITLQKERDSLSIAEGRLIPIKAEKIPSLLVDLEERSMLAERINRLSKSVEVVEVNGTFIMKTGRTRAKE